MLSLWRTYGSEPIKRIFERFEIKKAVCIDAGQDFEARLQELKLHVAFATRFDPDTIESIITGAAVVVSGRTACDREILAIELGVDGVTPTKLIVINVPRRVARAYTIDDYRTTHISWCVDPVADQVETAGSKDDDDDINGPVDHAGFAIIVFERVQPMSEELYFPLDTRAPCAE